MINKWILNNFKSIEEPENLVFRPLTIFTGANSSGKSTVLQSILLVSQTLQSPIDSRSIVLNGGIKKFGSYSDIVNRREHKKDLTIGFDITDDLFVSKRFYSPLMEEVKHLHCQFVVGSKIKDNLQPDIKKLEINCLDGAMKSATLSIKQRSRIAGHLKELVDLGKLPRLDEMRYDVKAKIDDGFSNVRFEGRSSKDKYAGASFTHFLPNYVLSYYDRISRISTRFFERLDGRMHPRYYGLDGEDVKLLSDLLRPVGMKIAEELSESFESISNAQRRSIAKERYEQYMTDGEIEQLFDVIRIASTHSAQADQYIKTLKDATREFEPVYGFDHTVSHFIPGVDFIKEFFSNHIWYLGPLREEPKALYPLESDGSMHDVGYKGENAAAVFDYNRNESIDYIAPSAFENLDNVKLSKGKGTLEEAVTQWLVYLGVANDIATSDRGKIGHTMQISNDLKIKQDLTHVGVGVSQVLPILIMSLLADKGDVIILEQPELHLHPKVQTRLADFFVSMNALGKQCLVETHSEYMINRLRYLVAKSEDSKISSDTMIYFVHKEDNHSVYQQVTINKYGVIADWPEGFFDESEKTAADVLKAGVEKRKKERLSNKEKSTKKI